MQSATPECDPRQTHRETHGALPHSVTPDRPTGTPTGHSLHLLLHGFRVPQQQLAGNLVSALAADVWSREVHLGSEAWSRGRTDKRGPVGAARERQDPAIHAGLGQHPSHPQGLGPPQNQALQSSAGVGSSLPLTWACRR